MNSRPIIGVSACLLGLPVRYDGAGKQFPLLVSRLQSKAELIPVCPEMAIGLGVPREPIQLMGDPKNPRLVVVKDASRDLTRRMRNFTRDESLRLRDISGFVFKSKSPSCGLKGVTVRQEQRRARVRKGRGLFAGGLMMEHPLLPVEDEVRLRDGWVCENFLWRVSVYRQWQILSHNSLDAAGLAAFHDRYGDSLRFHSLAASRRVERLLRQSSGLGVQQVADAYITELMKALKRPIGRQAR